MIFLPSIGEKQTWVAILQCEPDTPIGANGFNFSGGLSQHMTVTVNNQIA